MLPLFPTARLIHVPIVGLQTTCLVPALSPDRTSFLRQPDAADLLSFVVTGTVAMVLRGKSSKMPTAWTSDLRVLRKGVPGECLPALKRIMSRVDDIDNRESLSRAMLEALLSPLIENFIHADKNVSAEALMVGTSILFDCTLVLPPGGWKKLMSGIMAAWDKNDPGLQEEIVARMHEAILEYAPDIAAFSNRKDIPAVLHAEVLDWAMEIELMEESEWLDLDPVRDLLKLLKSSSDHPVIQRHVSVLVSKRYLELAEAWPREPETVTRAFYMAPIKEIFRELVDHALEAGDYRFLNMLLGHSEAAEEEFSYAARMLQKVRPWKS